jgi:hypothetical protein
MSNHCRRWLALITVLDEFDQRAGADHVPFRPIADIALQVKKT